MAKKKNKPQVINHIQEVNLEIDYKKLAEEIVRAQCKAEEIIEDRANDECDDTFIGMGKSIWYTIINKKQVHKDVFAQAISKLTCFVFNASAILLTIAGLFCMGLASNSMTDVRNGQLAEIWNLILFVLTGAATFITALFMRGMANDIAREKNKNYIIAIFSSVVSFAALLVALVALFKGVG